MRWCFTSHAGMTGQSDKDAAVKLGKALNVDSLLSRTVNSGNTCAGKATMSVVWA